MCNIHQWLLSNRLTLNIDKTEYMIIGTHQRLAKVSKEFNVSIDGKTVKQAGTRKSTTSVKSVKTKGIGS